jgi:hypothetical protein
MLLSLYFGYIIEMKIYVKYFTTVGTNKAIQNLNLLKDA